MSAEEKRMTLGEHIDELRTRLLRSLAAVAVGMIVCFFFGEHLFALMFWPLAVATGGNPPSLNIQSLPESFTTYLHVCLAAGVVLSAPVWIHQIWQFVAAGLYEHERRTVRRCLVPSVLLFLLGVAFFMVVVAPLVARFFLLFAQRHYPAPPN